MTRPKTAFFASFWPFFALLVAFFDSFSAGCNAAKANAQPPSLFFTSDELQRVESVFQQPAPVETQGNDTVELNAIMYYGPDNWAVWLQGERWTPTTRKPDLRILSVTPSLVEIALPQESDKTFKGIALRPHQVYSRSTGKISEKPQ